MQGDGHVLPLLESGYDHVVSVDDFLEESSFFGFDKPGNKGVLQLLVH
jgi:hypothetical protein